MRTINGLSTFHLLAKFLDHNFDGSKELTDGMLKYRTPKVFPLA